MDNKPHDVNIDRFRFLKMTDPRLVPKIRERLKNDDHHAVFAHGECFRFALRLHDRFGYKIRGTKTNHAGKPTWSHVWAVKEAELGIDIGGMKDEKLIAFIAGGPPEIFDADPNELRTIIADRGYPADLNSELDALADRIFDTHERYEMAKYVETPESRAFANELRSSLRKGGT